jgi:hypothetical protein
MAVYLLFGPLGTLAAVLCASPTPTHPRDPPGPGYPPRTFWGIPRGTSQGPPGAPRGTARDTQGTPQGTPRGAVWGAALGVCFRDTFGGHIKMMWNPEIIGGGANQAAGPTAPGCHHWARLLASGQLSMLCVLLGRRYSPGTPKFNF